MMGGLLAPLFLAGIGLLVIPWLVHQIRRPEHKPVRFSSLMFVPQTRKLVVRRRKIQHLLLMLLRMALLALLALAFTRPYRLAPATRAAAQGENVRHVILLDASYSMGTRNWFEDARAQALKLVGRLGAGDRVGVIAFDAAPRVLAPLDAPGDPDAGSTARARQAIKSAGLGWQATAYLPALQAAQAMLLGDRAAPPPSGPQPRCVIHLFTDFQHAGMPEGAPSWKLSSRVELQAIEVGSQAAAAPNFGLSDLAVDEVTSHSLRIRAKVKNWNASAGGPVDVKLISGGNTRSVRTTPLKPGNATQATWTLPNPNEAKIEGRIELGGDALGADNRFYFAWNPQPPHDVLLVADPVAEGRRAAARFIQLALGGGPDAPWALREAAQGALPGLLADAAGAPEIVLAGDLEALGREPARALLDHVRGGGSALVLLGSRATSATLNPFLLEPLGITRDGVHTKSPSESSFLTFSWIDLDHRMFMAFRDPRTSDFSGLHFFNAQKLTMTPRPGAPPLRVLARMDDGTPAVIEARHGKGTMILWAFGLDLEWTNLPKKATFVPLLHETLGYLARNSDKHATRRVGETVSAAPAGGFGGASWLIQAPEASTPATFSPAANRPVLLEQPGFLRWKTAGDSGWRRVDPVNIDPRESDPARISIPEFRIRLCSPSATQTAREQTSNADDSLNAMMVKREWGRAVLGLLLIFLLLETVYATRLAAAAERKEAELES